MPRYIAVAGKGGVGKTTFTALLLRELVRQKPDLSILAVDADPNANLSEALGMPADSAISDILDETKKTLEIPEGMPKELYVQSKIQEMLVESDAIDLLVMGGPQGPGCYCYANNLLRNYLESLASGYDFVTVDTEAGLEHISRGTIPQVDVMFVVSDSSARAIRSAGRVYELIKGLQSPIKEVYLIVTKTAPGTLESLDSEIKATGLQVIGEIPLDPEVSRKDLAGDPLYGLDDASSAVKAVHEIVKAARVLD